MVKVLSHKIIGWRLLPVGERARVVIRPSRRFVSGEGVLVDRAAPVEVAAQVVAVAVAGYTQPALELPEVLLHATEDSSDPAVTYSVILTDERGGFLQRLVRAMTVPAVAEVGWDELLRRASAA